MSIPHQFLKEIFLSDPLTFPTMLEALQTNGMSLKQFKESLIKTAHITGLTNSEIGKRIDLAVNQKEWLFRAIRERGKIKTTFSKKDKTKLYKGMLLTRATDNALKHLFLSGEISYIGKGFQGKGFRSLGQEAIFGVPCKLKHGPAFLDNGIYTGDVAAPLIRDLGVFLAMSDNDVATAINAQAGKKGKPSDGRDLHLGDFSMGILAPAAPLAIATCTLVGLAYSFKIKHEPRVAISFIGEGGSSLGEWHEAINFASVFNLPMIFCIENNQMALSTPVKLQSRTRTFADKAIGYGIPSLVIDGNNVEDVASSFKFAADEARVGRGPILIELITMRMCGHAHHDDMLYLGQEPVLDFDIGPLKRKGYVDQDLFEQYRKKDPIKLYESQLLEEDILSSKTIELFKKETQALVQDAIEKIKSRPWSQFKKRDQELIYKSPWIFKRPCQFTNAFSADGVTYLQAIALGIKNALLKHKNCLVVGEDIGAPYGNAFMMFKEIFQDFNDRFINTPISENAIVGACIGMAMGGLLPIGEIQFNDFSACAMDQIVNNAAKNFFRLGINVPMVLRMPYGGLRRAGPFHSQDTSPWFYRTAGLKIMAPSTPNDAMHMLIKAIEDPDPVLFYEHITLYRDPKIKQQLSAASDCQMDGAAVIVPGNVLTIISYGAYIHIAKAAADRLFLESGLKAEVIDLRYLMPVDFATIYASIKKTALALLVGEDSKNGGILESIASNIGQELFRYLDAPVTVLGSRNMPVPYAPSLEDDYLLSEQMIIDEAYKLIKF
jgi:2-oxoisovalerate dehydrogenase E1 component